MLQGDTEQHFREFKLTLILYVVALAFYSYWLQSTPQKYTFTTTQQLVSEVSNFAREQKIETPNHISGILLKQGKQQFIATQRPPDWANKFKRWN